MTSSAVERVKLKFVPSALHLLTPAPRSLETDFGEFQADRECPPLRFPKAKLRKWVDAQEKLLSKFGQFFLLRVSSGERSLF